MNLPVGSCAVDTRTGRLGVVMGHEGPYVQLRPFGGGREWDVGPDTVRGATPDERLRAVTGHDGAHGPGELC
ncbi:hypothetical protein ABZX39_07330 [Streptomyces collinus]|uniref:hypothetical protein n=1 Tax=Streptomyces collinus TaxID=42684 RepID=UPI0033A2986B